MRCVHEILQPGQTCNEEPALETKLPGYGWRPICLDHFSAWIFACKVSGMPIEKRAIQQGET